MGNLQGDDAALNAQTDRRSDTETLTGKSGRDLESGHRGNRRVLLGNLAGSA
jgi:hypothetical protein